MGQRYAFSRKVADGLLDWIRAEKVSSGLITLMIEYDLILHLTDTLCLAVDVLDLSSSPKRLPYPMLLQCRSLFPFGRSTKPVPFSS